ncbi:hypothetical protein IU443_29180 [Nocardia farcinica]|nr:MULTISPECIES: hypothetical protein [Nocardia]MBA4859703.1 hypothetical protein [Nocardia farcinica]MBC9819631.1 hypothetical protein [Nocardia farcinica]MBF6072655.1 hypothetical protein [Nocardia farcinica]MBF6143494.1 hypothetical protein [Nocardia farcinica]MBF6189344.1 hypothetical protein [Nocardia farcinica]
MLLEASPKRRAVRPAAGGARRGRVERGTAVLALIAAVAFAVGVGALSRSMTTGLFAGASISAGVPLALAMLPRP